MTQYEVGEVARPVTGRWMRASVLAGLLGGAMTAVTGLALLTVLNEAEFEYVEPFGTLAMLVLAFALPALYASERQWFDRLATVGFGLLSVGWVAATLGLVVTSLTVPPVSEVGFLAFLLGLLVATLGMLAFGAAVLRDGAATLPRVGAWLLVAALPVGVPFAIAFTTYVMGEAADPWAGPMLCYGLAWIVFGRYLWGRRAGTAATEVAAQSQ